MENKASVVIPAYNEEDRIGNVISPLVDSYEVIVVDDNSSDETAKVSREMGAKVLTNEENMGYIHSIKRGFKEASEDIIVTMDADGEHKPKDVGRLVKPVENNFYDLVFGAREKIPRLSERFLNWVAGTKVDVSDTGTGFRALKKSLAEKLELNTSCICGTFALEAKEKGAEIGEVPVKTKKIEKPRTIAWNHFFQFFHVLKHIMIQ